MNNDKRLKKLLRRSWLDSIARSLHRQAMASEHMCELYERAIKLQEQSLALSEKTCKSSQTMANIANRNYADRLIAENRQATMADETP